MKRFLKACVFPLLMFLFFGGLAILHFLIVHQLWILKVVNR